MVVQSNRVPKDEVNYRLHEQCSNCIHYYSSACEIVRGKISPDAVCNEWRLKEASSTHDGNFYSDEYKEKRK